MILKKQEKRKRRHGKIRAKISGVKSRPRLCVFRSSKHIYAQLIDDKNKKTLISVSDFEVKSKISSKSSRKGKLAIAFEVGKLIAQKAKDNKIEKIVFDRGGYLFHGRVKALADGAREEGLQF